MLGSSIIATQRHPKDTLRCLLSCAGLQEPPSRAFSPIARLALWGKK